MERCTEILKYCGVDIPSAEGLSQYSLSTGDWSDLISDTELSEVLDIYGVSVFLKQMLLFYRNRLV